MQLSISESLEGDLECTHKFLLNETTFHKFEPKKI